MTVPPIQAGGSFSADRGQAKTRRNHVAALSVLVVGAGIVAAIAAAKASGPFAGLRLSSHSPAATTHLVKTVIPATAIDASSVFPPAAQPATVQKVVTVYDMAAAAPASAKAADRHESKGDAAEAAAKASGSGHRPKGTPQPSSTPQPKGTPEPKSTPEPSPTPEPIGH
jgi:hypothetical protein